MRLSGPASTTTHASVFPLSPSSRTPFAGSRSEERPDVPSVDGTWPGTDRADANPELGEDGPPVDGAWRVWETLRGWDQRFAIAVDATLAMGLFVLCSGWFVFSNGPASDLWLVAGLTFPLMLRRRAPIPVFLVIAARRTGAMAGRRPARGRLRALGRPFHRDDRMRLARGRRGRADRRNRCDHGHGALDAHRQLLQVTDLPHRDGRRCPPGRRRRTHLRQQMGWLVERAQRLEFERDQQSFLAAAAERARIAREMHDVVSHNIQVMVTLADAAAIAQRTDPQRATEAITEVSGAGRQALQRHASTAGPSP